MIRNRGLPVTQEIAGYCTLCRSRCGTVNLVEGDRLVAVKPRPGHPTGRATCAKGRAAPELVHSTRRLLAPLRRTRPKGATDPGWQEIGWDEALDEVASRLDGLRRQHGAESVAFSVTSPSGTSLSDSIDWIERFIRLFGSPNISYATEICNWHKDFAHAFTFGCGIPSPDYAAADLILLWGHNPANAWLAQAGEIGVAQAKGARLMVVDPRRTAHAARADHWLRVRPGADAALALGLMHLLIEQGGYDEAFTRAWTNAPFLVRGDTGRLLRGADFGRPDAADHFVALGTGGTPILLDTRQPPDAALATAALRGTFAIPTAEGILQCRPVFDLLAERCAAYPPARVEALTGIPETELRAAARAIGSARSVAYYSWNGLGQHVNATQAERAVACLYALTGSFDAPGGNLALNRQPVNRVSDIALLAPGQRRKALGLAERPIGPPAMGWVTTRDLYTAILEGEPYPVRALMGFGSNPLVSQADPGRAARALQALDFYVHCDLFENPSARHADILLPVASAWEQEALKIGFEISAAAEEWIQLRPQMVPARGAARSDRAIVFALAQRLGLGDAFFGGDMDRAWNHVLAPLGLTVEALRRAPDGLRRPLQQSPRKYADAQGDEVRGFATESRRVELYSETLLRHGYPPLPDAAAETVAGKSAGLPHVLTTAKTGYYCHTQHRGLASLRARAPEPYVALHPDLARAKGIAAGDQAMIRTRAGRAVFRVRLDEALHPEVVAADYGWWQPCDDLGLPGSDPLADDGSNYNRLISAEERDPISGSVPHRAFACDVERWDAGAPRGWPGFRPFRVQALEREAEDTLSVMLAPEDGGKLPDFCPGQHLLLRAEAAAGGRAVSRAYSLSSAAREAGRDAYRVTVRKVMEGGVDGLFSTFVTRRLQPGDRVEAQAPSGVFTIPTRCDFPIVLIAAGIGITPFISHLETVARAGQGPEILLLYGNRDGGTHAFRQRLQEMQARLPCLTIRNVYSRPRPGDAAGRDYDRRGRIGPDDIPQALIDRRARIYICGPPAMLRDLRAGLVARGVPGFEIFEEVFRAQGEVALPPGAAFTVRFARTGREAVWTPDRGPLLGFAEALGLEAASGCRVGQCESCAVRIVQGEVRHLVPGEHLAADACLTCQAVPASDLVLDL
ncbi:molybdopterin-dependent oxidoreductase [Plastoroseomonas hellenica]|uniref:molybdopterin-dependent oxidoreductase n=1 Tax=Plastoroseomonas hellenica TaxID=2687306 RepID=UPI001BA61916|nr:molybdopterin-dependent oxidoreductase [Plastoroseomonas hellenica]MBR0647013.1 molybdopterin-dependent oxidoreductase [Plastoroseomonas hellenica]